MPGGQLDNSKIIFRPERSISVCVWGASRPEYLKPTIETFKKHVKFSGTVRWCLSEDFRHPELSEESVKIAQDYRFDAIYKYNWRSLGYCMTDVFQNWVRDRYMFSLEEDWECLRDIDLDVAYDLMEKYRHVNQIKWNKYTNTKHHYDFVMPERTLELNGKNYQFMGSRHWYFNPALWRMEFSNRMWCGARENIHIHQNRPPALYPAGPEPSPEWYADKLGALTWGPEGEEKYFKHIGVKQARSL